MTEPTPTPTPTHVRPIMCRLCGSKLFHLAVAYGSNEIVARCGNGCGTPELLGRAYGAAESPIPVVRVVTSKPDGEERH